MMHQGNLTDHAQRRARCPIGTAEGDPSIPHIMAQRLLSGGRSGGRNRTQLPQARSKVRGCAHRESPGRERLVRSFGDCGLVDNDPEPEPRENRDHI